MATNINVIDIPALDQKQQDLVDILLDVLSAAREGKIDGLAVVQVYPKGCLRSWWWGREAHVNLAMIAAAHKLAFDMTANFEQVDEAGLDG